MAIEAAAQDYSCSYAGELVLAPVHIEVTQGIQLADNTVPLLANRATMIRVTVGCVCMHGCLAGKGFPSQESSGEAECNICPTATCEVTGTLSVSEQIGSDAWREYISDTPPLNADATVYVYPIDDEHDYLSNDPISPEVFPVDEFDNTLNFLIPAGQLREGPQEFTVRLERRQYCSQDYVCPGINAVELTVEPEVPPFRVFERRVQWIGAGHTQNLDHLDSGERYRFADAIMPARIQPVVLKRETETLGSIRVGYNTPGVDYDFYDVRGMSSFRQRLKAESAKLKEWGVQHDAYFAWITTDESISYRYRSWWVAKVRTSAGVCLRKRFHDVVIGYGRTSQADYSIIFAHELAHGLYVLFCHPGDCDSADDCPSDYCDLPADLAIGFPEGHTLIRPGIDVRGGLPNRTGPGIHTQGTWQHVRRSSQKDFMCGTLDITGAFNTWVHHETYSRLLEHCFRSARRLRTDPVLLIQGFLFEGETTIEDLAAIPLSEGTPTSVSPDGDVLLFAYSAATQPETLLFERRYELAHYDTEATQYLSVFIEATYGGLSVDRVVLAAPDKGVEYGSLSRSPNAPIITFDSIPPTIDEVTPISWTGSDADGDSLLYYLRYESDAPGAACVPLVLGSTMTSIMLDPNTLPRSSTGGATLHLTATDGFNETTIAATGLTVDVAHAPSIQILSPADGFSISRGAVFTLEAYTHDLEDGELDDASIIWSSNIHGVLGRGRTLLESRLAVGHHTITATVRDSDGATAQDSVNIEIHAAPRALGDIDRDGEVDCDDWLYLSDEVDTGESRCHSCDLDGDSVVSTLDLDVLLGLMFDCNTNGRPDVCDVQEGAGTDSDANDILDECEADASTWYVDDDAPNDPGPGDPSTSDPDEDGSESHPFDSIQEAIDASGDYDRVLVADGVYTGDGNRDISFLGKPITLQSINGPQDCVVDCQGSTEEPHRGFRFQNGETMLSILDGLTIRNGYSNGLGGGVSIDNSHPTIRNCMIKENYAYSGGGGISCNGSSPRILDCVLSNNSCRSTARGGGFLSQDSSPFLARCQIDSNQEGGVFIRGGSPFVTGCFIWGNGVSWEGLTGAGIGCTGSDTIITDCTIVGNVSESLSIDSTAGGLWFQLDRSIVRNCEIFGNNNLSGGGHGGGITCAHGSPKLIENCSVFANAAQFIGGGIFCTYPLLDPYWGESTPVIRNCTVYSNMVLCVPGDCPPAETDGAGGGIAAAYGASPSVVGCILWGNFATRGSQVYLGRGPSEWGPLESDAFMTLAYSDVQGGLGGTFSDGGSVLTWGDGNIDADPLFLDSAQYDFRLETGSPAIDAGDPNSVAFSSRDLSGGPRVQGGRVDMGAYEYRFFDLDGNGVLGATDLALFVSCLNGPDNWFPPSGCDPADFTRSDFDGDGDVDLRDFAMFQVTFGGP
ncbi:MAG: right-handed parallel beta-helix repeat-containing protein [Phycisphaerae bacterium]|jgi:hypothetical protein